MSLNELLLREARRVALAAKGVDRRRPSGRVGTRDLSRKIRQLGLLQFDYTNALRERIATLQWM